ncbi:putative membrane protein [Lysinibacillus sp. RC79]
MDKKGLLIGFLTVFVISLTYNIMSSIQLSNIWILNQGINSIVSLVVFFIFTRIWSYFKKEKFFS